MKEQLIKLVHKEHEAFLAKLKKEPADVIIDSAYEICYREEFIFILESRDFDDEEIEKLLQFPNPVEFLYDEWFKTDASVCEMLEEVITDFLYKEV